MDLMDIFSIIVCNCIVFIYKLDFYLFSKNASVSSRDRLLIIYNNVHPVVDIDVNVSTSNEPIHCLSV